MHTFKIPQRIPTNKVKKRGQTQKHFHYIKLKKSTSIIHSACLAAASPGSAHDRHSAPSSPHLLSISLPRDLPRGTGGWLPGRVEPSTGVHGSVRGWWVTVLRLEDF